MSRSLLPPGASADDELDAELVVMLQKQHMVIGSATVLGYVRDLAPYPPHVRLAAVRLTTRVWPKPDAERVAHMASCIAESGMPAVLRAVRNWAKRLPLERMVSVSGPDMQIWAAALALAKRELESDAWTPAPPPDRYDPPHLVRQRALEAEGLTPHEARTQALGELDPAMARLFADDTPPARPPPRAARTERDASVRVSITRGDPCAMPPEDAGATHLYAFEQSVAAAIRDVRIWTLHRPETLDALTKLRARYRRQGDGMGPLMPAEVAERRKRRRKMTPEQWAEAEAQQKAERQPMTMAGAHMTWEPGG